MCLLLQWLSCLFLHGLEFMAEFMWSDFLLALIAVVLAVLLATGYPGERKVKTKKVKRDYKAEWSEL
jgi:hypothetical protein